MLQPEIDFTKFRKNLRIARGLLDMSAKDVAIRAGLRQHKRALDIEEGRGKPTLEEVFSLCVAVDQPSIDNMLHKDAVIRFE